MPKFQPSRSQVAIDERSILATVPGLPWWGVIATLVVFTAAGAALSSTMSGGHVGAMCIGIGAVAAVLVARNRNLFTAIVQPPLLMFVTVPLYNWLAMSDASARPAQIVLDVGLPLVRLFPWMFWISVVTALIGIARFVLYRSLTRAARAAARTDRRSTKSVSEPASARLRLKDIADKAVAAPPAPARKHAAVAGAGATATALLSDKPTDRATARTTAGAASATAGIGAKARDLFGRLAGGRDTDQRSRTAGTRRSATDRPVRSGDRRTDRPRTADRPRTEERQLAAERARAKDRPRAQERPRTQDRPRTAERAQDRKPAPERIDERGGRHAPRTPGRPVDGRTSRLVPPGMADTQIVPPVRDEPPAWARDPRRAAADPRERPGAIG
ncbi:DUF6542 domain-containing protein, partial [Tsukamurella soli]